VEKKKTHPPPTEEEQRFKDLLRKLVAVPVAEVHDKRKEHRKRKRKPSR
jgi:hypothetical protein